jgi:hypothetical protein
MLKMLMKGPRASSNGPIVSVLIQTGNGFLNAL